MDKYSIQKLVDAEYPPTHTFDIETLKPTKLLKERYDLMIRFAPEFFTGERFLDIGCNMGFFSFLVSPTFEDVVGIDTNKQHIELCEELKPNQKTKFYNISFRNFISYEDFDRVMLGNVAHHIFKEINSWAWISKLAAYSRSLVLLEGAKNTKCKDIAELIPQNLHQKYNTFMYEMGKFFDLIKITPTIKYTPDRFLMLFKKKQSSVQLAQLPFIKEIKQCDFHIFESKLYRPFMKFFKTKRKVIAKISNRGKNDMTRIRVASASPISNGMIAEIYDGDEWVGWLEEYTGKPHKYFENEKELFTKLCQHQIFLSKVGYIDVDFATINFSKKKKTLFDKSQVFPIKDSDPKYFIKLLNQSFKTVDERRKMEMLAALESKNPVLIEQAFMGR